MNPTISKSRALEWAGDYVSRGESDRDVRIALTAANHNQHTVSMVLTEMRKIVVANRRAARRG